MQTTTKKILIIEDEQDFAGLLVERLKADGYDAIAAFDGEHGLKAAKAMRPDLILLDLMLPGMDGRAVLMELKLYEETRDTPVVVITAIEDAFNRNFTRGLGADDYIVKPFDSEKFVAMIRAHLGS